MLSRPETGPSKTLPIVALVLGILSIPAVVAMVIGGVPVGLGAAIVGSVALVHMRRGAARGRGMVIAGIATGVIGVLLSGAAFAGFLLLGA